MKEATFVPNVTLAQRLVRWLRNVATVLIGLCMILVWTGVNNTLLGLFLWHTGPQAMPSYIYTLDPLGQVMAWGVLCLALLIIWWPVLSRKVAGQRD